MSDVIPMLGVSINTLAMAKVLMLQKSHSNLVLFSSGAPSTPVGKPATTAMGIPVFRLDSPHEGCKLVLEARNEYHTPAYRLGWNGMEWVEVSV